MTNTTVITHQYTDGTQIDACPACDGDVPSYSDTGASYSGVSHGAHDGDCDLCADAAPRIIPTAATSRATAVATGWDNCDKISILVHGVGAGR